MINNLDEVFKGLERDRVSVDNLKGFYVYALWNNSRIVYIGQTIHLESRIKTHMASKEFDEYSYIECKDFSEMEDLESNLILKLKPLHNTMLGSSFESLAQVRKRIKALVEEHKYDSNFYVNNIRKKLELSGIEMFEFRGSTVVRKTDIPVVMGVLLSEE